MEPVQPVLRFRAEVQRQLAHGVAPVGQELHSLVHLQALGLQDLDEPSLGLGVEARHEREARWIPPLAQDLAGDHLETSLHSGPGMAGVDVAAVQADDQGRIGAGKLVPVALAPVDEGDLLIPQLAFGPLGDALHLPTHRGLGQLLAQRQDLRQQLHRQPV